MVYSENAKLMDVQELKDMIEEHFMNPTIDRMVFIETKGNEVFPSKVFPCYLEAWSTEGNKVPEKDSLIFQCVIMQCVNGEFACLKIILHEKELGINKRIWDKPPARKLRDEIPFLSSEVVQ